MQRELGSRIKKLRLSKNMTLKELGEQTHLSVSYLSTLERGLCSASLVTLQNISEALGVESSTFISVDEPENVVMRSYGRMPLRLDGSSRIYQSLVKNKSEGRQFYPMLVTLLPGRDIRKVVPYSHAGEELVYVLEGVLTIVFKDRRCEVGAGESAHYFASTPHEWNNCTDRLVKLLSFTTDSAIGGIAGGWKDSQPGTEKKDAEC